MSGHVTHADMHPLTKARVDAGAEHGRRLAALLDGCKLLGRGEVTGAYVKRLRDECDQALQRLVEAAQDEGARTPIVGATAEDADLILRAAEHRYKHDRLWPAGTNARARQDKARAELRAALDRASVMS